MFVHKFFGFFSNSFFLFKKKLITFRAQFLVEGITLGFTLYPGHSHNHNHNHIGEHLDSDWSNSS